MTNEPSDIQADIKAAAKAAEYKLMRAPFPDGGWMAIAEVIVAERQKAEKLADEMYLTGVSDAEAWARKWGHHDFADRLVREVNERSKASGLPPMRAGA